MTYNQKTWLKALYFNAASEFRDGARNMHIMAMGSETQESAVKLEQYADEQRQFAQVLTDMANEINIE